ncbi:MAG: tetratricopeptide repeat protein [Cyanobacteriota bacterium]|jgi:tetratricopeptide (TPR) repeat protein
MKFPLTSTLLIATFLGAIAPDLAYSYPPVTEILIAQRNSANAFFQQGSQKYRQGKFKEAIVNFDKLIQIKPDFIQAYVYRGLSHKRLGMLDKAIDDYTKAINLSTKNPQDQASILYSRGIAYSDSGKLTESVADFTQIIKISKDKDLKADAYYQRGFIYSEKGSILGKDNYIQKAIDDFTAVIKFKSSHLSAYTQRGIIYNSYYGDGLAATDDFMKAVRLKPKDADDYWNRGTARSSTGNMKGALDDFNQAISLNPNYSRAYSSRAGIRYLLGDKKGANADVNKALEKMDKARPDVSSWYTLLTTSSDDQLQQKIYALADQAIDDSPETSKDNLLLYLVRGNIRLFQKNTQGALDAFDKVISLNSEFPIAYYLRAFSRTNTPDARKKSLEDLNEAIKLSPNFAQAYLARGYLTKSQADFNQAIDIYKRVISRNPNSIDAYARRRRIYSYIGNVEEADLDLLQIVKLRRKQGITSVVSKCDNQRLLATFRDLLSCQ